MSHLDMYLLITVGNIKPFFCVLGFVIFIVSFICFINVIIDNDLWNKNTSYKKPLTGCIIGAFVCFIGIMAPSTKQIAAIYLIPKIVNNETIQSIGSNNLTIIDEQVKLWLKDITEKGE